MRIEWIDTLKAFGIFLVFIGHSPIPEYAERYIFSFHMPLFFFISGMFFNYSNASADWRSYIRSKIIERLTPYFLFGILTYLIWLALALLRKYGVYKGSHSVSDLFVGPLVGMLYGNGHDGWLVHNRLLWFLACLLVTEILFCLIFKSFKEYKKILGVLLLFSLAGYLDSLYSYVRLPFSMDIALTAVVFYGLGFITKDYFLSSERRVVLPVLAVLVGCFAAFLNGRVVNMNHNEYGSYLLFYLASLSSIFGFVTLVKYVPAVKSLSYIGRNSLSFFLLQNPAFFAVNILLYLFLGIKTKDLNPDLFISSLCVVASILVLFPVVYVINTKFSFLVKFPRKDKAVYGDFNRLTENNSLSVGRPRPEGDRI